MAVQIQIRRDTAANFTSNNPTLASGEIAFETDTAKIKFGDGSTAWTSLVYIDDKSLKNDAVDVGIQLTLTGDSSSADTQYTAQVLYNTDATPPTASGFPIGTIYIQYTA